MVSDLDSCTEDSDASYSTALDRALDVGDWGTVVQEAALTNNDCTNDTSISISDSNFVDESFDLQSRGVEKISAEETAALDNPIDQGNWTGVIDAASRFTKTPLRKCTNMACSEYQDEETSSIIANHTGVVQRTPPASRSHTRLRRKERWWILALSCIVMSGLYYCLDIPAALHQELKDFMPRCENFEFRFNLLYTVYSLPNVILPFFAGNIVDRLSAPTCLVGFVLLIFIGQIIFAAGTAYQSWMIMFLGRMVYGFGGESCYVASSTLLSQWFHGGEVAFAFSVALAIGRLGSVLNNFASPIVADYLSVPYALWTGAALNGISLSIVVLLYNLNKKYARQRSTRDEAMNRLEDPLLIQDDEEDDDDDDDLTSTCEEENMTIDESPGALPSDVLRFGLIFWVLSLSCIVVYGCVIPFNNVASGLLLERNYFKAPPTKCMLYHPDQCTSGTFQNYSNPSTDSNGNSCPQSYAYAPLLPTTLNITGSRDSWEKSSYVFNSLSSADVDCNDPFWAAACTKDYCDAQHKATERSGRVMSVPYIISASLSPILGYFVDKIGKRAKLASLASLTLMVVHATLALTNISPVGPLIGQGIAYALYASVLWPCVPLTVETRLTGTAFGVITSLQNMGLALFPLIIATIYSYSGNRYIPNVEFFFVACGVAGVLSGIALDTLDKKEGARLDSPTIIDLNPEEYVFVPLSEVLSNS